MTSKSAFIPAQALVRRDARAPSEARAQISGNAAPVHQAGLSSATGELLDTRGRVLRDLRLSVTDRCNLRCTYCMPKEVFGPGYPFLPKRELLSFEELTEVARMFVELGVRKIRLTGGEPLLRAELPRLVSMLSALDVELALTTNGLLLGKHVAALAEAGLHRVTVSLDALSDHNLRRMSGKPDVTVEPILQAIEQARGLGLGVKVNTVVRRSVNEEEVLPLIAHFRGKGVAVRFIEYMDVGESNRWQLEEVVPSEQLLATIQKSFPLRALPPLHKSDVARVYEHQDGQGEVGVIASVTAPFCGDCTRARVSAKGELFTCLFAGSGIDLRTPLRQRGAQATKELIVSTWQQRGDRYSEVRSSLTPTDEALDGHTSKRVEMSYIGG